MAFAAVSRINNPRSDNNGMWAVEVSTGWGKPMETVYMSRSKKACVEYAKTICDNPHIGNGIDYGARW